jgi:glycosyltransferase involved in cell wall biosynthesis
MSRPLVSIVTPFYNSAAFLDDCIRSVLAQTYGDFEYLLVDNCSTDGSTEIAERYARQDSRIRFLRNERHVPQVPNYNGALRHLSERSEYCKVVQADDWIFERCIEAMVEVAESNPSVGIVGAYTLNTDNVYLDGLRYSNTVVDGRELCRRFIVDGLYVFGSPTATLIRSSIVRSRPDFYELNDPVEDFHVCLDILQNWNFGFVHQVLTYTRRDNDSITSSQKGFNPILMARLTSLRRYGQLLLAEAEYRKVDRRLTHEHYLLLGEAVWRRRGARFWQYQAEGLAVVGERIGRPRVGLYTLLVLAEHLLNPLQTVETAVRSLLQRRRQAHQERASARPHGILTKTGQR